MNYRRLGKTNLMVSEIGFGAEWLDGMDDDCARQLAQSAVEAGVNIVDCWMSDPAVRATLGRAIAPERDRWIIQGHIGSTWQNDQYVRSRDLAAARQAFDDQLRLLQTDYVELGMIHYVDEIAEFDEIMAGEFYAYVEELLAAGRIQHVGLSTHNPAVVKRAAEDGRIEMVMFSVNPAFDMLPACDDIDVMFGDFDESLAGMDSGSCGGVCGMRAQRCGHYRNEGLCRRALVGCRKVTVRCGAYARAMHPLRAYEAGGGKRAGGCENSGAAAAGGEVLRGID